MDAVKRPQPFGAFLDKELPKQKDWIGPGILPRGGTMFLAGGPKVGKSFLCLGLCRALSLGETPFDCPLMWVPEPAKVLYLEAEVKEQGVQARGRRVFGDVDWDDLNENLYLLTDTPEMQFDSPFGFKLLREAIGDVKPNVVIIDPLGRFIGGLDENSNSEMNKVLTKLDQIVKDNRDREMALIIAHHSKKPDWVNDNFDPLSPYNMRGSSRFFANPDTIVMADRKESYTNGDKGKAWKVDARFVTRQAEELDDLHFTVNDRDDLRVRWVAPSSAPPKLNKKLVTPPEVEQLQFMGV